MQKTRSGSRSCAFHFWKISSTSALHPATPTVSSTVYTMAALFRFDTVSGYRRVFDVKLGTSDGGLYVRDGKLTFFPQAEAASASVAANQWVQVVITRDSAKNITGYVDGVQQFRFVDTNDDGVLAADAASTYGLRWFADNTSGGVTGDCFGCIAYTTQTLVLLAAAARLPS